MCGIIGYVGKKSASPILLEGLRRLEYRGYDSAGIAVLQEADLLVRKKRGKIDSGLATVLQTDPVAGNLGIGHTRWATHGIPSDKNCHPHFDQSEKIAVVHNGVIENYDALKEKLARRRTHFQIRHRHGSARAFDRRLLCKNSAAKIKNALTQAVCDALREVIGTYGIAVICADEPDKMVGARRGSPLIIGIGKGENFLASDANAIVAHTKKVVYLNDYDVATITPKKFKVINLGTDTANVQISKLEFDQEDAVRGEHAHFMLKEIYEQPRTIENALRGRVDHKNATAKFGGLNLSENELRSIDRIIIAASGTSWHAALVGEYLIEEFARHSGRGRIRARILLSQRAAGKKHRAARALAIRRNSRHARRVARGKKARPQSAGHRQRRRQHASRAKPTAAFICTPGRKSASPRQRLLSRRSRFCRCWRFIWDECENFPRIARWKFCTRSKRCRNRSNPFSRKIIH